MVVRKRYIGTQTRPDSALNGILYQEDCFATCCVGSDVAHFSSPRTLTSETLAAIRVCKCHERLDSQMNIGLGHKQDQQVPPQQNPTPGRLFRNVLRWLRSSVLLIFSPHRPLVSQTLAAIRVCKCRERLDSQMVVPKRYIGTQKELTVPPTESYARKTVSQRAVLAPTLLIFRQFDRARVTNSGSNSRVQVL